MAKPVFDDMKQYGTSDLAGTHRSTAGTQETVDRAVVDRAMAALDAQGFVVFEGLLPEDDVERIRADIMPRFAHDGGRNNFEGFATQRLYALIEKTFSCNPLVEHPLVLALLDRVLEPNYLLSQLQAINIRPGEAQQPLHYDDAFYPWPRPRRALGAATIWAIDPFTRENGATVVVPGSHLWGDEVPRNEQAQPVVMAPGSVVFFLGTLWHGGGENRTDRGRLCVTAQYCAPWLRQQENFSISVSRARVRQCSEHVQRMVGYSIHPPFMGMVDGMHPKRTLER
jgi:ectoine hydroxylase-related dioxygenase (phytanoyl-CoA dioxygenase family)